MKRITFFLIVCCHLTAFTQTRFEFGYSFGANGTIIKTPHGDNNTWGFRTPAIPRTWNNSFFFGVVKNKNTFLLNFDNGALGLMTRVKAYPDKYSFDDKPSNLTYTNMSVETGIGGGTQRNTNLLKFSFYYKRDWFVKDRLTIKSVVGAGFLKTRVQNLKFSTGGLQFADSIGFFTHQVVGDLSVYHRNWNVMLTFGVEFSYKFAKNWSWNASILYNQGIYRVLRFHSYRYFHEFDSGYTEFDEQWSVSRLSHYSLLTGVSFRFGDKKKK